MPSASVPSECNVFQGQGQRRYLREGLLAELYIWNLHLKGGALWEIGARQRRPMKSQGRTPSGEEQGTVLQSVVIQ
jgi:hypothetical protein